ncbi:MAG: hypothetical protein AAF545_11910 [Pseudomonadota bacterium]
MNRRNQTSRFAAVVACAALALAGCSSSDDDAPIDDDTAAGDPPAAQNAPQLTTPGALADTAIGPVFSKAIDGLTLYTFENDRNDADGDGLGDSDCNGNCAETWPPLLADSNAVAEGSFSIITRDDGLALQWAFKGLPLYTFSGDANTAEVNGDGSGGTWFVARPDPWQRAEVNGAANGTVFAGLGSVRNVDGSGGQADTRVDREGFTLYTFENDRNDASGDGAGDSDCNGGCAETWPPLFADAGATPGGPFTIIDRDDGSRQWALNGLPLYFYAPDQVPGDTLGEGAGNVWFVARPTPIAGGGSAIGSIVVAGTDTAALDATGGPAATRNELAGFSLYVFDVDVTDGDGDGFGDSDCNGGCAEAWPPLFADAAATPRVPFSLITRDDGNTQWALRGEPLYFFANDLAQGDVNGDEVGGVWHTARIAPVQTVTDANAGLIFEARGTVADVDTNGERADTRSDRTGFTLYRFEDDRTDTEGDGAGDSDCNGGCATTWPPLYAEADDTPLGAWNIIDRSDGSRQWTYRGDPVYFFVGDASPEDVNGVYGTWFALSPL